MSTHKTRRYVNEDTCHITVSACQLIDRGVTPTEVQHQLGHHSAAFTLDVYSKRIKKVEAVTSVLDSVQNI
jgi:integrase